MENQAKLDALDYAILSELEADARLPLTELSRRLNVPGSTVRDRVKELEASGVIMGYAARLNPAKLGLGIKAIIQASRAQSVSLTDFRDEATRFAQVTQVQLVTGETDQFITVYARDVEELKDIIYNKIGELPGLTRSNTAIVLEEQHFSLTQRFVGLDDDIE